MKRVSEDEKGPNLVGWSFPPSAFSVAGAHVPPKPMAAAAMPAMTAVDIVSARGGEAEGEEGRAGARDRTRQEEGRALALKGYGRWRVTVRMDRRGEKEEAT